MNTKAVETAVADATPVLQLRDVTFQGQSENSVAMSQVNLSLQPGEIAIIHLKPTRKTREVASMLQGLLPTASGEVLFQGQSWADHDFDRHFRMRSRIGRVFDGQAWVENLNVAENVTLARRHHKIDIDNINTDVKAWVKQFGMIDLSRKRPAFVEPSSLQLHQWVRAFIMRPQLLILERPLQSLPAVRLADLVDALRMLQRQGTAVLWFTSVEELLQDSRLRHVRHYHFRGEELQPRQGDSTVE